MIYKAVLVHEQKLGLREGRLSYQACIIVDGEVYSRKNHNPCKSLLYKSRLQTSSVIASAFCWISFPTAHLGEFVKALQVANCFVFVDWQHSYDPNLLLHGEQYLEIYQPLPANAIVWCLITSNWIMQQLLSLLSISYSEILIWEPALMITS